jgi:hypothetical protein
MIDSKNWARDLQFVWCEPEYGEGTNVIGKFIVFLSYQPGDTSYILAAGNFSAHKNIDPYLVSTPIAAGTFNKDGTVLSWESTYFEVKTPEEFRIPIQDLLIYNKEKIAKNWLE